MECEPPPLEGASYLLLLVSGEKRRRRDRPQTGVSTPGTSALTKLSPEGATEYITCLITTCLGLCRPVGASLVVALLPGACAPVCGLSSLDFVDLWFGTLEYARFDCSPSGKQKDRHISGGDQDLPRTAVTPLRVLETHPQRWGFTLRGA